MAAPGDNENCHHVQNDFQRCEINLEKFHSDILCCYGVIKERFWGGGGGNPPPPGQVRLNKL